MRGECCSGHAEGRCAARFQDIHPCASVRLCRMQSHLMVQPSFSRHKGADSAACCCNLPSRCKVILGLIPSHPVVTCLSARDAAAAGCAWCCGSHTAARLQDHMVRPHAPVDDALFVQVAQCRQQRLDDAHHSIVLRQAAGSALHRQQDTIMEGASNPENPQAKAAAVTMLKHHCITSATFK